MKKIFQLIISFIVAMYVLKMVSFAIIERQLLDSAEQDKWRENKTFWVWNTPQGPYSMHYVEKGNGPHHVLLLHGFRANTFTWRYLIDPLAQAGFHVWAIDLLGYGFSDKPKHIDYTLDFFLDQVDAFMKENAISQAHLIGNSMGGGIALNLALKHSHHIKSLTLISALAYPIDFRLYVLMSKYLGHLCLPFLGPTMIRKGLEQIVYQKDRVTNDQVQAYLLPYYFPGGRKASLSTLENFDNAKLKLVSEKYVEKIKCPLLIIWGEYDTLLPVTHYNRFCQDFPLAKTLLIKDCGHIPHEETPDEVEVAILDFLKELKKEPLKKD